MSISIRTAIMILVVVVFGGTGCISASSWEDDFDLSKRTLLPTGRNPYFVLEPGFRVVLEGEEGFFRKKDVKVVITVLSETREVQGILTRVVEEKEWINGELYEISKNFFAICDSSKDVFYFGEDVNFYKKRKVINHKGSWLAGKDGAKPGLIMSGNPKVGMKYYQEVAPKVAMDRAEIISLDHQLDTPAGTLKNCLKTKEGTALSMFEREYKSYAPGVGLVQDQNLLLIEYGFVTEDSMETEEM